jgi:hypothetical protein
MEAVRGKAIEPIFPPAGSKIDHANCVRGIEQFTKTIGERPVDNRELNILIGASYRAVFRDAAGDFDTRLIDGYIRLLNGLLDVARSHRVASSTYQRIEEVCLAAKSALAGARAS